MSTTAATQAIRDFNHGRDNNPYCPKYDQLSHDAYNGMMEFKKETESIAYEQEQIDTHNSLMEGE